MSILLIASDYELTPYRDALVKRDPNLEVDIWPAVKDPSRVSFVVAWYQPEGVLNRFPNVKVIASLGAGAEHLVSDPSIPEDVVLTRLIAPRIKTQIAEYVEAVAYSIIRRFPDYYRQQHATIWDPLSHSLKSERRIGVLGLGKLGAHVAETLASHGWPVSGWARTSKSIPGCTSYAGTDELDTFLEETRLLVNLLPLTPETEGILELELFKKLKSPSWVINVGRGDHLVEEDLLYAIDKGILEGAHLDVFRVEPLPDNHPFWSRKAITITPHVGSFTYPDELAEQILDNYKRMISGIPLLDTVDRNRGY